tara:strand:- start:699 stop:1745 length:1047 start_codon:yes stop_codon:yes gene_type:complete
MSESHLNFSKEVATTVGLEEAVMLEYLTNHASSNNPLSIHKIDSDLDFWSYEQIKVILSRLSKTGLIKQSFKNSIESYSLKEKQKQTISIPEQEWLPNREIMDQIIEYGISEDFAMMQIKDFIKFSQERDFKETNWEIKFLRFVIKKWRYKEVEDNKRKKTVPIGKEWVPDNDAMEILVNSGIDSGFIKDTLPEFILYWAERKEESDTWNSKFIAHVRRQWGRDKNLNENDIPAKITSEWMPNDDFYSVLELTDIPKSFADDAVPEFILYWKETGQSLNSWNSKFLQHVKYHWERTNKGSNLKVSQQIDRRIESSWKIQNEQSVQKNIKIDNSSNQEKFKKLKEKHRI